MPVRNGIVAVNGALLAWELHGGGPAVVLISGGATLDRRMWHEQIAAFARGHTVLSYDIRGIGASSHPDAPFSHGDDLHALLQAVGLASAHVVGLSLGAGIAVDFALDHPEVVKGLVLAAPGLSSDKDENARAALAAADLARQTSVANVVDAIVASPTMLKAAGAAVRARVRDMYLDNADVFRSDFALVRLWRPTAPPAGQRLSAIDAPTLILVGDADTEHVRATAERIASGIPGALQVVVEGAGHLLNLDAPDRFNETVLDFLGGGR